MESPASESTWSPQQIAALAERLLAWFRKHCRDLPWRRTRDPYAIWVSEIMLQQTQVATVVSYYERFMQRFPDVTALADADEQEVLAAWSGLGYYRRAKQLHAAAKKIVAEFGGRFPRQFEAIRSLPGIGRYTAGAIASQAFGMPVPIVEANTQRVYARWLGLRGELHASPGQRTLWRFAESLHAVPLDDHGEFNQALMELGSLVCTPTTPACNDCPVQMHCVARQRGWVEQITGSKKRVETTEKWHACLLIRRRGKWLMRQNAPGGWWAGLWDFPRFDISHLAAALATDNATSRDAPDDLHARIRDAAAEQLRIQCSSVQMIGRFTHAVTRYRIRLVCFSASVPRLKLAELAGTWRWMDTSSDSLPLTSSAQRILNQFLTNCHGAKD